MEWTRMARIITKGDSNMNRNHKPHYLGVCALVLSLLTAAWNSHAQTPDPGGSASVSQRFSQPAYADLGAGQHLTPLFPDDPTPTLQPWENQRTEWLRRWNDLLGQPSFGDYDKTPSVLETYDHPEFKGTLLRQPTGPDTRQLILLMEPKTNWQDPWYLGDQIKAKDFPLAHHQLLALHAPRSFLLIAGQYDKPESWPYLLEAQKVCALYNRKESIGMLDHASGHAPTAEAMHQAYQWLAEQFGLNSRPWER